MQHQHTPMSTGSLPSATKPTSTGTAILHNNLHIGVLARMACMPPPPPPSLSSGDVDTASPSTHIITPPDINLILTSRPKRFLASSFERYSQCSRPSPPARLAIVTRQSFSSRVACFNWTTFGSFAIRKSKAEFMPPPPPHQPPANIPSCLPPSHPSSAATSHLQLEFSAFTFHAVLLPTQLKADLTATPGLFAYGTMSRMRVPLAL